MKWYFGQYLQTQMNKQGLSPAKLAHLAKLSHVYVGTLLRGESAGNAAHPKISVETLVTLSKALNIPEYKLILAYKGKDPDKALDEQRALFDLKSVIDSELMRLGKDASKLSKEKRRILEEKLARILTQFVNTVLSEESI